MKRPTQLFEGLRNVLHCCTRMLCTRERALIPSLDSFLSLLIAGYLSVCSLVPATAWAIDVGQPAPSFRAKTYGGKDVSLADYKGKVVVLEWFNPDCPFVRKHYDTGAMQKLQREVREAGAVWLTINSTAANHPNFRKPEQGPELQEQLKIASTELIIDPDGALGKLYGAQTTPHLFVIGVDGVLRYDGAIDDAPDTSSDPATAKSYVRAALRALHDGKPIEDSYTKPYGCSVKYAG